MPKGIFKHKPSQGYQKGHPQSNTGRTWFKKGMKPNKYWLGKKMSEEHRKKISEGNKGRIVSKKTREKIGKAHKGKKLSEEHKKKLSLVKLGKYGRESNGWRGKNFNRQKWLKERRARKLGAEGGHTQGEWETLKAQYNWTCPCCKKLEPEIKLTEDHIVPLTKGGSDNIENIQPLCRNCNCKKHTKIIKFWR